MLVNESQPENARVSIVETPSGKYTEASAVHNAKTLSLTTSILSGKVKELRDER